jgi:hypothetical protein
MTRDELKEAIRKFLEGGGKIIICKPKDKPQKRQPKVKVIVPVVVKRVCPFKRWGTFISLVKN